MSFRKITHFLWSAAILLALLVSSCRPDEPDPVQQLVSDFDAEAAVEWNKYFLEAERYAAGYRPAPAPRALAYLGLAAYEACISGMPDYNSLGDRYAGLDIPDPVAGEEYHWPTVVHFVYSTMIPLFFQPEPPQDVVNKMIALRSNLESKYLAQAGSEVFQRSKDYGIAVGEAVWDWSATDPYGHDAYKNPFGNFTTGETYDWQAHYDGPGDWVPTDPGPGAPMGPFFGKFRTFAITEAQKLSAPPIPYSESPTSSFYAQALQVYSINTPTLSDEDEWVGEFWSDDLLNLTFSPGPRWVAIGIQIIESEEADLQTALEAFAKTGMALNDAAVACWHSKYVYNLERPESYIKRIIDPNWEPSLDNPLTGETGMTPSFPAYPSGHSTMGGAGAEALASVFGYSYAMTDRCHEGRTEFRGEPRSFPSLYDMAYENGWSRVPLGVHFWMDCEEGIRFGTDIGREVNKLPWRK
ncbi:MAG: vanadium-dependent haloperoxidase [Saprospiraceae bacterium]